jgi:hypothetical protein
MITAIVVVCVIAVDQFPELLLLKDNTSNDFTIRKESSAPSALMLGVANHHSISLNPECPEFHKRIRRLPIFEDASSADFLLLSVLRR